MSPKRFLITGSNGQVGFELMRSLAPLGQVVGVDVKECDLAQSAAIDALLERVKPDIIINPAAYTEVDKAESEPTIAHAVNAQAPKLLARYAARHNIPIIHFSVLWWNSLHQPPSIAMGKSAMAPVFLYGLLAASVGFSLIFGGVVLMRMRAILATMALAVATPSAADAAGARPTKAMEAAATTATAAIDLRMDLSSSRGVLTNPSNEKLHERPWNVKGFPSHLGHELTSRP